MATKVTTAGRDWMIDKLDTTVATKMEYIGMGTRVGPSGSGVTLSQPSSDTNRAVGTITATATRAVTNAGTFTAASSGTLGVHGDFTTVNLLSGDAITFTIDSQITTA
jgi:hypothetical protein